MAPVAAVTEETAATLFALNVPIAQAIAEQSARPGRFPPMSPRPLLFPGM
ncbi:hypothetical protein [Desulfobacter sp.]